MDDKEIKAMAAIAEAFASLSDADSDTVERVLRWASSRYGRKGVLTGVQSERPVVESRAMLPAGSRTDVPVETASWNDAAELFAAVDPSLEFEKAVVMAYWLQKLEGRADFTAQEINALLKNLGHGIGNITDALTGAMSRKPALVIQTRKSGSSRQARKNYRVTTAGLRWVEERARAERSGSTVEARESED